MAGTWSVRVVVVKWSINHTVQSITNQSIIINVGISVVSSRSGEEQTQYRHETGERDSDDGGRMNGDARIGANR